MRQSFVFTGIAAFLFLSGCLGEVRNEAGESPAVDDGVEVTLVPQAPDADGGRRINWSPYGRQLPMWEENGGLSTALSLGPEGTGAVALRLEKSDASPYFDRLLVDLDRDGKFTPGEVLETEVTESNHKFWSSFDAVVDVPVTDPRTGRPSLNPYPLSLWYVEDPRVPDEEPVLRFARRGWMEGSVVLDGVPAVVMVTEDVMDGVYAMDDAWALASRDSAADVLTYPYAKSLGEHGWLFEKAYRVTEIDPSGRRLSLAPFDPGITRSEEIRMNDDLAVDRDAPRSGRSVAFLQDFSDAEARARREGKALLIDFETTWCGPCKLMDEWVYTADPVVDATAGLVAVKVDGDERLDLKERFRVTGFPTVILLDSAGEELRRASGYVNVADMTDLLSSGG